MNELEQPEIQEIGFADILIKDGVMPVTTDPHTGRGPWYETADLAYEE
jgi:hypothetical protein